MVVSKIKLALDVASDLKSLAESIEILVQAMESNVSLDGQAVKKEETTKGNAKDKASKSKNVTPKNEPALEDVRKVLAEKSRAGHTAAVKEAIQSFGVSKLSEIDASKYEALLDEVEGLIT